MKKYYIISLAIVFNSALAYDCQDLYDEIQELKDDLNSTYVDQYSQHSVDNYNQKIYHLNELADQFNTYCVNQQQSSSLGLTPDDSLKIMNSVQTADANAEAMAQSAEKELNSLLNPNPQEAANYEMFNASLREKANNKIREDLAIAIQLRNQKLREFALQEQAKQNAFNNALKLKQQADLNAYRQALLDSKEAKSSVSGGNKTGKIGANGLPENINELITPFQQHTYSDKYMIQEWQEYEDEQVKNVLNAVPSANAKAVRKWLNDAQKPAQYKNLKESIVKREFMFKIIISILGIILFLIIIRLLSGFLYMAKMYFKFKQYSNAGYSEEEINQKIAEEYLQDMQKYIQSDEYKKEVDKALTKFKKSQKQN